MSEEINEFVMQIKNKENTREYNDFVESYKPFILNVSSNQLGRYIQVENDEAFSIAIEAFCESIRSFDMNRGNFISFAKLVISRRLINYINRTKGIEYQDIEKLSIADSKDFPEDILLIKEEIEVFENTLKLFNITFDDLIENGPKHKDTRQNAKLLARRTSEHKDLVTEMYDKKRLPISKMCLRFTTTRKFIYGSKNYIIAIVIVFTKKLSIIKNMI